MVTTMFWRDGWKQEMRNGDEVRWAEGQRVELTEAGRADAAARPPARSPTPALAAARDPPSGETQQFQLEERRDDVDRAT